MQLLKKITRSNFYTKLMHWEYWPFGIVQFPIFFYYGWLALRSRSFLFFTASNPGIEMGGMFGESKFNILKRIPQHLIPKTILIEKSVSVDEVLNLLKENSFRFPVIFKPDLGERGFMVQRINNEQEVATYLNKVRVKFLAQELVEMPMEFGVFYHRHPATQTGSVTSIVMKEMLSVTGNGRSTLRNLILDKPRAKLHWKTLSEKYQQDLDKVIERGKIVELVSIGNHAKGTKFLNGNHLINEKLSRSFDLISKTIEGFYFGRFDLRCNSIEELENGKVKILELNGCGAEPAHIYDPDFKILDAIKVLIIHWRTIFEISRENNRRGFKFNSYAEGKDYYRRFKEATR